MATNNINSISGYSGGLEGLGLSITSSLPKFWNYFAKTISPLLDATLIQLFGSYDKFSKGQSEVNLEFNQTNGAISNINITLHILVPDLKGASADVNAELEDKTFIITKLGVLAQYVTVQNAGIRFNTQRGELIISMSVKI